MMQTEALRLADWLTNNSVVPLAKHIAMELRRLDALVKEQAAQLEAIGAGGVESLRKNNPRIRPLEASGITEFKVFLQQCDDHAIVADVVGAFHAGWNARAAKEPK